MGWPPWSPAPSIDVHDGLVEAIAELPERDRGRPGFCQDLCAATLFGFVVVVAVGAVAVAVAVGEVAVGVEVVVEVGLAGVVLFWWVDTRRCDSSQTDSVIDHASI